MVAVGRVVRELYQQHQQVRLASPFTLRQLRRSRGLVLRRCMARRLERQVVGKFRHRLRGRKEQ